MSATRDTALDAVKGLAIVLMVMCHAGAAAGIRDFVYLFHMPVFFLAAGWCYRFGQVATLSGGGGMFSAGYPASICRSRSSAARLSWGMT